LKAVVGVVGIMKCIQTSYYAEAKLPKEIKAAEPATIQ
jgi:hypothetical protein